jgi:hypothetical protein
MSTRQQFVMRCAGAALLLLRRGMATGGPSHQIYRPQVPTALPSLPGVAWEAMSAEDRRVAEQQLQHPCDQAVGVGDCPHAHTRKLPPHRPAAESVARRLGFRSSCHALLTRKSMVIGLLPAAVCRCVTECIRCCPSQARGVDTDNRRCWCMRPCRRCT